MTKPKWNIDRRKYGTIYKLGDFEISKSYDKSWDITEGESYLCSTRYLPRAKQICERLLKSTS